MRRNDHCWNHHDNAILLTFCRLFRPLEIVNITLLHFSFKCNPFVSLWLRLVWCLSWNLNPRMSFTGHVRKTKDEKNLSPRPARADLDPGPHCSAPVYEIILQQSTQEKKTKLSIFYRKVFISNRLVLSKIKKILSHVLVSFTVSSFLVLNVLYYI